MLGFLRRLFRRRPPVETEVLIGPDGTVRFVHDDDVAELFAGEGLVTHRASHVEPETDGTWTVDLRPVGGPVVLRFARRDAALAWERDWLRRRLGGGS